MESLGIRSVSLPIGLVGLIIEAWLNEHEFKSAHRVTRVDVIDAYDQADGLVHVDLEAAPEQVRPVVTAQVRELRIHDGGRTNGNSNGHSVVDVVGERGRERLIVAPESAATVASTTEPVTTSTDGRKRTQRIDDATRAAVLRLRSDGVPALRIASQLGLGESSVYHIVATARGQAGAE